MLRQHGWTVAFPERTFATVDHIVPTQLAAAAVSRRDGRGDDVGARAQLPRVRHQALDARTATNQGIVHVIGPELGLTQPGMTIACGDSHTSTHGAFGAIAFGIGTSQVRDVLASQCLALDPLKVRRIDVNGTPAARRLREGRDPDDHPPPRRAGRRRLRVRVRRHTPSTRMTIDERMTICNMSIEGGARVGYVNPDETTFAYPARAAVRARRRRVRSRGRVVAPDRVGPRRDVRRPRRPSTRRRSSRRSRGASTRASRSASPSRFHASADDEALAFMGFAARRARRAARGSTSRSSARAPTAGCRISKRRRASCSGHHVAPHVKALVVPGSQAVQPRGRKRAACTRCSSTPGSNGAAPAARCASA